MFIYLFIFLINLKDDCFKRFYLSGCFIDTTGSKEIGMSHVFWDSPYVLLKKTPCEPCSYKRPYLLKRGCMYTDIPFLRIDKILIDSYPLSDVSVSFNFI